MAPAYGNLMTFNKETFMRIFGHLAMMVIMSVFLTTTASAFLIRYDGPYEGRVIDAETKQPIEGVVVLGVWYKQIPNVAGSNSIYYDAKETVTDKNGEFRIEGLGLKIFSYVGTMHVLLFKAGHEYLGLWPWETLKEDGMLRESIKWEGEKAIIPLKKFTMEERKKRHADKELIPDQKQKLLIRELNKEYKELGIPLYPEVD
ncbi:MAG: hypothetical protein Q7U10_12105 [Thermodesulfovibrionia bacterium]|nr:hypothetical protein [Thermodesulfovibrionia bacterium]